MTKRKFAVCLSAVLAALTTVAVRSRSEGVLEPGNVTEERVFREASIGDNWLVPGGSFENPHYSPLRDINDGNASKIGLAWSLDISSTMGLASEPIVVDGVAYVSAPLSRVYAVDAATGKLLWSFDPHIKLGESTQNSYSARVNRGVAVWKGKVYVSTGDCQLIAMTAKEGKRLWSSPVCDPRQTGSTAAPHVIKDKVVIGYNGSDDKVRGSLVAFDAETGKEAWRFWTVPGDPKGSESAALKMAAATWRGKDWWTVGGGDAWDPVTYDPQTGYLLFGTAGAGGGEGTDPGEPPEGAKLFSGCILAIKPETGEYVWHYQTSSKYLQTENFHIIVTDIEMNGERKRVAITAPKNGFIYVLDARTGKLVNGGPMVQTTWAHSLNLETGKPNEVSPPPKGARNRIFESWQWTVHNWWPMSYNPITKLVYVPISDKKPGTGAVSNWSEEGNVLVGRLLAWDPVANKPRWSVPHTLAVNSGVLSTAGNLVFQGDGEGEFAAYTADKGEKVWSLKTGSAIDSVPVTYRVNGEQYVLVPVGWGSASRLFAPAREMATPASERGPSRLLAFKLNGTAEFQYPEIRIPPVPKPPAQTFSKAQIEQGKELYESHLCSGCHSPGMDGSGAWVEDGAVPDLRYMPTKSHQNWYAIILAGSHKEQGMLGFGTTDLHYPDVRKLSVAEADAIHAYVIDEEWKAYNKEHSSGN